jgi:hypothetical protein
MNRSNFADAAAWAKLRESFQQSLSNYEEAADKFWDNLSYDDKLYAFYFVCKRIYKGEVEQRHTYRGVLYDVFKFDPDAYGLGMDCRYMDLHNLLSQAVELQASAKLKETSSEADDE